MKMKKVAAATLLGAAAVNGEVFFEEKFGEGWEDKWVVSKWKGAEMGDFDLAAGKYGEDKGLMTKQNAKFYGISAKYPSFTNKGKTTYFQYSVKYENDVECGGGYVKIGATMEDQEKFGDPTEYNIMFGPDKCGATKRTHLIFSYKGKNHLKRTDLPYKQDTMGETQLYTLTLTDAGKVKVEIGDEKVYEGELEKDWPLLPAKEIDDPEDKKPDDWIDEAMMDDPADKKPEDWDQAEEIVDADAKQPEDWDADEDGEWEPPMKKNPDFKGEWKAKKIMNPGYKGVWKPKQIPNPEYEADDALYAYKDFGFMGVDVWQVKAGTIFDNMLITDDEEKVKEAKEEWKKVRDAEKAKKKEEADKKSAEAPKEEAKDEDGDDDDMDDVDTEDDSPSDDDDEDL